MKSNSRLMMIVFIYSFASFALWGCADGNQVQGRSSKVQRTPISQEKKAEIIEKSKLRQSEEEKKRRDKQNSGGDNNTGSGSGAGNNNGSGNSTGGNSNSGGGNNNANNGDNDKKDSTTNESESFIPNFKAAADITLTDENRAAYKQKAFDENCKTKGLPTPIPVLAAELKKDSVARYSFQLSYNETMIRGSRVEKVTSISDSEIQLQSELTLFKKKQDGVIKVSIKPDLSIEDSKSRPDKFLSDFQYCNIKGQANPEVPELIAVGEFFISKDKSLKAYQFERSTFNVAVECQAKDSNVTSVTNRNSGSNADSSTLTKKSEVRVDQIERFVYVPSAVNLGFNQCGGALVLRQKSIRLAKPTTAAGTSAALANNTNAATSAAGQENKAFYIENEVTYAPILKGEVRSK